MEFIEDECESQYLKTDDAGKHLPGLMQDTTDDPMFIFQAFNQGNLADVHTRLDVSELFRVSYMTLRNSWTSLGDDRRCERREGSAALGLE